MYVHQQDKFKEVEGRSPLSFTLWVICKINTISDFLRTGVFYILFILSDNMIGTRAGASVWADTEVNSQVVCFHLFLSSPDDAFLCSLTYL